MQATTSKLDLTTFKVKAKRLPSDISKLRKDYKFNSSNFLTIGSNPKLEKSLKVLDIPTAALALEPTVKACPWATVACRQLCLHTAGNPVYLPNKIKCRNRRYTAYFNLDTRSIFLRLLIIEVLRFYRKNSNKSMIAFRSNMVSDIAFEAQPVTITKEDSQWILDCFGINLNANTYGSIFETLNNAYDYLKERPVKDILYFYDYSKIPNGFNGRDYAKCKELGLHLTLSYGGKEQVEQWLKAGVTENIFDHAARYGLNVAAAWNSVEHGKEYPELMKVYGKTYKTTSGDLTDARFLDSQESMPLLIILLIKRSKGQTEAMRQAFSINDEIEA